MMDDAVDGSPAAPAHTTRRTSFEGHGARDERMLKALFDQSATAFAILDRDFKYVRVNAGFAQQLGAVVDRFPGTTYADAGGDCADTLRVLTEVARTKQALRVGARPEFWALNAAVANFDWMVEPLLDGDGELEWLGLSSIDVTELTRAELELRQRESLYHAVVTAMDEGVVCQSASGEITVANPAAESITGRSERDMAGHSLIRGGRRFTRMGRRFLGTSIRRW